MQNDCGEPIEKCPCFKESTETDVLKKAGELPGGCLAVYSFERRRSSESVEANFATLLYFKKNAKMKDFDINIDLMKLPCPRCRAHVENMKHLLVGKDAVENGEIISICKNCEGKIHHSHDCDYCNTAKSKLLEANEHEKDMDSAISNVYLKEILHNLHKPIQQRHEIIVPMSVTPVTGKVIGPGDKQDSIEVLMIGSEELVTAHTDVFRSLSNVDNMSSLLRRMGSPERESSPSQKEMVLKKYFHVAPGSQDSQTSNIKMEQSKTDSLHIDFDQNKHPTHISNTKKQISGSAGAVKINEDHTSKKVEISTQGFKNIDPRTVYQSKPYSPKVGLKHKYMGGFIKITQSDTMLNTRATKKKEHEQDFLYYFHTKKDKPLDDTHANSAELLRKTRDMLNKRLKTKEKEKRNKIEQDKARKGKQLELEQNRLKEQQRLENTEDIQESLKIKPSLQSFVKQKHEKYIGDTNVTRKMGKTTAKKEDNTTGEKYEKKKNEQRGIKTNQKANKTLENSNMMQKHKNAMKKEDISNKKNEDKSKMKKELSSENKSDAKKEHSNIKNEKATSNQNEKNTSGKKEHSHIKNEKATSNQNEKNTSGKKEHSHIKNEKATSNQNEKNTSGKKEHSNIKNEKATSNQNEKNTSGKKEHSNIKNEKATSNQNEKNTSGKKEHSNIKNEKATSKQNEKNTSDKKEKTQPTSNISHPAPTDKSEAKPKFESIDKNKVKKTSDMVRNEKNTPNDLFMKSLHAMQEQKKKTRSQELLVVIEKSENPKDHERKRSLERNPGMLERHLLHVDVQPDCPMCQYSDLGLLADLNLKDKNEKNNFKEKNMIYEDRIVTNVLQSDLIEGNRNEEKPILFQVNVTEEQPRCVVVQQDPAPARAKPGRAAPPTHLDKHSSHHDVSTANNTAPFSV